MCTDLLYSACEGVIFPFCSVSGTNWFPLETIATCVVFFVLYHRFVLLLVVTFVTPRVGRKGCYAFSSQETNLGEEKEKKKGDCSRGHTSLKMQKENC